MADHRRNPVSYLRALGLIGGVAVDLGRFVFARATPSHVQTAVAISPVVLGFLFELNLVSEMGTLSRILVGGLAVSTSWALTHMIFPLRYVDLYCSDDTTWDDVRSWQPRVS